MSPPPAGDAPLANPIHRPASQLECLWPDKMMSMTLGSILQVTAGLGSDCWVGLPPLFSDAPADS